MGDHNTGLNNLFGVTKAGKRNRKYDSLESAMDSWVREFGNRVQDSKSMHDFVSGLRHKGHTPYNSVNPNYDIDLLKQYNYLMKHK